MANLITIKLTAVNPGLANPWHRAGMDRAEFLSAVAALTAGVIVGCSDDEAVSTTTDNTGGNTSGPGTGGSGATGGSSNTSNGGSGATSSAGGSGGTGGTGTGGAGGGAGECTVEIDAQITCRHDHELIITVADLAAGVTKDYDIRGGANHPHTVTVTAEMFDQIKQGEVVEIFVPSAIQPHTVFIKCTGLDPDALDDQDCN